MNGFSGAKVTDRDSLLPWIIVFKAVKTIALGAVGVALLTTRQEDPIDVLTTLALRIHLPLSSAMFERALMFALNLSVAKQTALGITAFGYAALMGTEGASLYLRKPWARWFTIGATSSLVPIEIYEIIREPHMVRILVLLANVAIVIYLIRRRELFESR